MGLRRYRGLPRTRRDQPEEPNVLKGPPTHRSHIEAIAVRLYKFVGLTDLPRTGFRMHRHSSTPVAPLDSRVHKKLGSPGSCRMGIFGPARQGLARAARSVEIAVLPPQSHARPHPETGSYQQMNKDSTQYISTLNSAKYLFLIGFSSVLAELGRLGLEPRTKALKGPCSTN